VLAAPYVLHWAQVVMRVLRWALPAMLQRLWVLTARRALRSVLAAME
jgi:hypothetical protein